MSVFTIRPHDGRSCPAVYPVLFVFVLGLVSVAGQVDAQTARADTPLPRDAGFTDRVAWLAANPGTPAFAAELELLLETAGQIDQLRQITDTVLPLVTDRDLLAQSAGTVARVWMTNRDYERAARLFESAYVASGGSDLESLFAEAQALLQMGETTRAEQRGRVVVAETDNYELKRRAYALVARVMHLNGRSGEASRLLNTLTELDDASLVEPDTLLLQSAVLAAIGEQPQRALDQLARLHPHSVAYRLLDDRRISLAPLPLLVLSGPDLESRGAAPTETVAETAHTGSPAVTSIQVGSFSDPDNAHHLAEDLRGLGLEATTQRSDRDGQAIEIVLVNVAGGSAIETSRVLAVLHRAGYDGFMIY